MSDFDDSFWHKPKRPKREVVDEAMSRLTFGNHAQPPKHQGPLDVTEDERRALYERQDQMFAQGYVEVKGAPYPISRVLAAQLGYQVDRLPSPVPQYEAGDDVDARDD